MAISEDIAFVERAEPVSEKLGAIAFGIVTISETG